MYRRGLQNLIYLLAVSAPGSSALAVPRNSTCLTLKGMYGDKVSLPSSQEYEAIAPDNWSQAAQLDPSCTFEPSNAQDVSGALAVLIRDNAKFAVRGGGHMPVPGASNIDNGVLISLNAMRTTQLTKNNTVAQVGPGMRWGEVYEWIKDYGLGVSGGRFAPVGVSGLLLGGGISFFGPRFGWASNMVENYEVVLANSTIVNVNAQEHSDLFWALKGGANNYGIVTRFDLKTFPVSEVYAGQSTYSAEYLNEFIEATASYSVLGGGSDDIDGSYGPTVIVSVNTGVTTLLSACMHAGSDPNPAAFANFTRIPSLTTNNRVWSGLGDALVSTEAVGDRSQRQLFMATSTKATAEAVRIVNTTFFGTMELMPELKQVQNLTLRISPQHISKSYLEAAKASGGDPMDVEPGIGLLMNLVGAAWDNEEDDDVVYEFSRRVLATIEKESRAHGYDYPFVYINDADPSEKPFKLYGHGKSLPKMRAIRDKYDPNHYFQKLLPGGFKLQ
ncbi:hypothetical protein GGS21DRAFT_380653 [Xylaria nigripes]|nr:hypothetical protein GGS21DRAFT_380653 [Xylaria nigripes]